MSAVIDGLILGFQRNQDYGERLVGDLEQEQMALQPEGSRDLPVNHPAWALSHVNIYLPVILSVIKGEEFDDPKDHKFGMNSKPEPDAGIYGTKEQILADWSSGHEAVLDLLAASGEEIFDRPVHLERWSAAMPTAGVCLPYLMLNHENMHLGQISAWRRILGMPSV